MNNAFLSMRENLEILKSRGIKPFFVLTRSRTGSNMLISFLNSHPNIKAHYEIFRTLEGKNYKDIFNETFSKYDEDTKAIGFKIFYNHPLDVEKCDIWNFLINNKDFYVIHLKRKNILRTILSHKISKATGLWGIHNKETEEKRIKTCVEITDEELMNGIEKTKKWEAEADAMFSGHNLINISYEDMVYSPNTQLRLITVFLGLPFYEPKTIFKKQNPEKLSELITNYNELKNSFLQTEFEFMFND